MDRRRAKRISKGSARESIIQGKKPPEHMMPLEVAVKGVFNKNVFLELARDFLSFEFDGAKWFKKLAMYQ
ncbi:MAG: hypothetical protein ACUVTD_03695, partial [Nitrososphaerales archaeon]